MTTMVYRATLGLSLLSTVHMKALLVVIILALIGALGYIVYDKVLYGPSAPPTVVVVNTTTTEPVACTMDTMMCPDGSYVGRTGPKCEFEACPTSIGGENKIAWGVAIDGEQAKSFLYIDMLPTKYMRSTDKAFVTISSATPYACNLAGTDESVVVSGKTEKHTVGRQEYCVTTQSEGAAGSTYNTYTYVTAYEKGTVTFKFEVQQSQCANYNETERKTCEAERAIFSIDRFVDQIFTTYNWNAFTLGMQTN